MAPPTYVVDHTGAAKCPELLCLSPALLVAGWRPAPPRRALPLLHRSYELMRQTSSLLRIRVSTLISGGPCRSLRAPAGNRFFPTLSPQFFPQMPGPQPRRSHRVHLPVSSSASSAFLRPLSSRLPASSANTIFRGEVSRLSSDISCVQASEFACLPDRSYRCSYRCKAAETFTSEQNMRRYLLMHRIYYPPDYRQLAERGLSPRKTHSIVDCSSQLRGQPQCGVPYSYAGTAQHAKVVQRMDWRGIWHSFAPRARASITL